MITSHDCYHDSKKSMIWSLVIPPNDWSKMQLVHSPAIAGRDLASNLRVELCSWMPGEDAMVWMVPWYPLVPHHGIDWGLAYTLELLISPLGRKRSLLVQEVKTRWGTTTGSLAMKHRWASQAEFGYVWYLAGSWWIVSGDGEYVPLQTLKSAGQYSWGSYEKDDS